MTVDLFAHILANVVDIQKEHLLLHTPVLNKTPRISSARMFVRLYRLLLIHCIYLLVTKPTLFVCLFVCLFGAKRRINPCGSLASDGIKLNMMWMKTVKIKNKGNCIMIISCNTIVDRRDHVQYLTVSKSYSDNCTCSLTEQNTT